jgi:hypothetical protein
MTQLSESMLESSPVAPLIDAGVLARCVDECVACAQACVACADACLGSPDVKRLGRCIRLDADCADVCDATARVLSRSQHPDLESMRKLVEACALIAQRCAEECEEHQAMHEHCKVCATACRTCLKACGEVLRHLAHAPEGTSERPRHH